MMELVNPFGVYFNMIKMKYVDYDSLISTLNFLSPSDKVSCFINLETVWKYLTTTKDLEKKLISYPNFKTTMVADIINIAAHYREFFRNNGLDTKIYLYATSFNSTIGSYNESKYNEDYRSYYYNKYNTNPNIVLLTESLQEEILKNVKTILDFVPGVYMINSENIDSNLVPYIVSNIEPERKNLIISGDILDTQYYYVKNFLATYINRGINTGLTVSYNPESYIAILNKTRVLTPQPEINNNSSFYSLILSCLGEKYRSILSIRGIGVKTIISMIKDGINNNIITANTKSIEILKNIFKEDLQEDIINNFKSIDLFSRIDELNDSQILSIKNQLIDRVDINSLMKINKELFSESPLRIESLLN